MQLFEGANGILAREAATGSSSTDNSSSRKAHPGDARPDYRDGVWRIRPPKVRPLLQTGYGWK